MGAGAFLLFVGLATGERIYFSDQAAMTAGAVTAGNVDGGGIWYNPATLAARGDNHIDVSGSTFSLRVRNVDSAFALRINGGIAALPFSSIDVTSVPNVLSIVRRINDDVDLGLAVLITDHDLRSASSRATQAFTGGTVTQRMDVLTERTVYHAGIGVAWKYSPTLRLGASLFGSLLRESLSLQYSFEALTPGQAFAVLSDRESALSLGLEAMAGVNWQASEGWALAATLRSPRFTPVRDRNGATSQATGGGATEAAFVFTPVTATGAEPWIVTPLRAALGARYTFDEGSHIALDVEGFVPISDQDPTSIAALAVRLGGRWQITQTFALGLGAFVQTPGVSTTHGFGGGEKLTTVGGTLGAEYRTILGLQDRPEPIILSLTLAVRYAADIGVAGATVIDLATNANIEEQHSVTYHEVVPYVGSKVTF